MSAAQAECQSHDERYTDKRTLVSAGFVNGAYVVQKSIGRIVGTRLKATGFVISKGLVMTCEHVGRSVSQGDVIQIHYLEPTLPDIPGTDMSSQPVTYGLQPDVFYYGSPELDFAVIAVEKMNKDQNSSEEVKSISCINEVENQTCLAGRRLNIYSHPEGKPLMACFLQEGLVESPHKQLLLGSKKRPVTDEIILHKANTEEGSSGAPIFDDMWRLVGIHQGVATEKVQGSDKKPREDFYANYGTLIKYILDEMYSKPGDPLTEFEKRLGSCFDKVGVPFPAFSKKLKEKSRAYSGAKRTRKQKVSQEPEVTGAKRTRKQKVSQEPEVTGAKRTRKHKVSQEPEGTGAKRTRKHKVSQEPEVTVQVPRKRRKSETSVQENAVSAEANSKDSAIVLTHEELVDLSEEIASYWYSFGISLGESSKGLKVIRSNNIEFPDPEKKALEMLSNWMENGGTRAQLVAVLEKRRKGLLAKRFKRS